MFKELTKVFGETIVYGLIGTASTLISVFLVPIYTRILTPEDYGVTALLTTLFVIIGVIANLGMSSAIFWAYFKAKEEDRKAVVGTSFISQTIFPFLISAIAFLLSGFVSNALFGSQAYSYLVAISAVTLFFNIGVGVPLALLRAEGRPANFVSVSLSKIIATVLFSIVLVVLLKMGLAGVFWANLAGAILGYLVGLGYTLRRISFVFSKYWLTEMLKFGLPMVPAGLAMWALNSSDRYFLNAFASTADVGIYNVGYKVGSLVTLVVSALQLAYPRFVFSIYNEKPNPQDYFKKIITYFYLLNFTFALVISLFAKEAVQLLTGSAFHNAYVVVPLIAFSYVGLGLYYNFATGVFVVGKTFYTTFAVLLAGGLNLILNYLLISRFGMMGAAVSNLLSFALLALAELYFSQRVYPIKIEFKRLLTVAIVGGGLTYISSLVSGGLFVSLVIKTLIFISFPIALYTLGFFEERELKKMAKIWVIVKESRCRPKKILDSIRQDLIA
jgi:O-antigen/teichoic acid export membrane protein